LKLLQGDCLEHLKTLPDNSIDLVLTDPPYGLSFMGKKWDYDVPKVEVWQECIRVLKPGGHLLAFAGTRTQHRMAVRIEDAGFEIRDMIAWVYGSGFPKSHNVSKAIDKAAGAEREVVGQRKQRANNPENSNAPMNASIGEFELITAPATPEAKEWEGWGSSLKPALEPLTLARKPLEGTIAENVLKWGTGALNVDAARVETDESLQRPERRGLGQTGGWANYSQTPGMYGTPQGQGRFPANLIHDGSDEVLALFPETKSGSRKAGQYTIAAGHGRYGEYGEGEMPEIEGSSGSAARFFYCAKASKSERGEANNHPTVKPIKLMEYLVKLASREGAVILDPYLGSGTTGIACRNLNRQFIGIELDPAYFEIARKRIEGIFQEVA
jgi:DNA modification methylase